ncbi:MAG TPA: tRNA (adenosine(37)-N6)-dimethylallyltransferase MiaA [Candidatus Binatia bacterium]|jgi:tRNA dimethylallyltransferase|nr:tRNA (adenosine(37)-N6)-dimethylallyltransferase MiaA [Candidatus Binatia bacterium]
MRPKIVIILGATAVGKSEIALRLAETVNGEIVNADSQQVYRHMDIGTGKPSKADRERVRHHLIDIVAPNEEFNAALFRRLATDSIGQIHARERNVIVCGGTGLYLRALTHGLFEGPGQDADVRHALEQEIASSGLAVLYERLEKIDPTVGATIHRNDRQRIIRALEVYQLTCRPLSEWQKEHRFQEEPFEILKIGLLRERAELYDLINLRSERMIKDGFLEEVRSLVARGFDLALKPLRSVGYRQMGQVLRGLQSVEDALEEMKQETRHLAKRQLTWFRRDQEIHWYHPEKQQREILQSAERFL